MQSESPFAPTVLRVIAIEAAVITALWLLGRYFAS